MSILYLKERKVFFLIENNINIMLFLKLNERSEGNSFINRRGTPNW